MRDPEADPAALYPPRPAAEHQCSLLYQVSSLPRMGIMEKVTGIGGVFFHSDQADRCDPAHLGAVQSAVNP